MPLLRAGDSHDHGPGLFVLELGWTAANGDLVFAYFDLPVRFELHELCGALWMSRRGLFDLEPKTNQAVGPGLGNSNSAANHHLRRHLLDLESVGETSPGDSGQ